MAVAVFSRSILHCNTVVQLWSLCRAFSHKANLRDLVAVTSLIILLKLDFFFGPYYLEIRWMNSKNNRAPPLCYVNLNPLFQSHHWIHTGVTVQICSIQLKIGNFSPHVTLEFKGWPWKTIGHLFCATSSFVRHFMAIGQSISELQPGNVQFGCKSANVCPVWP